MQVDSRISLFVLLWFISYVYCARSASWDAPRSILHVRFNKTLATIFLLRPMLSGKNGKTIQLFVLISALLTHYGAIRFIITAITNSIELPHALRMHGWAFYVALAVLVIGLGFCRVKYEERYKPRLERACSRYKYTGEHHGLYAVAINTLLESKESFCDSQEPLEVIETDKFGRTLFYYGEDPALNEHHLIVSQESGGDNNSYYIGRRLLSAPSREFETSRMKIDSDEMASARKHIDLNAIFTEKAIKRLKKINDWDKPPKSHRYMYRYRFYNVNNIVHICD